MKEVEVFGVIMANKFQPSKMRQHFAIMIIICILVQLGVGISQAEVKAFGDCFGTEDFKEGTSAFLEKRKADFPGK